MLTVAKIKNAKARERSYKLFDGKGLFLLVSPAKTKPKGVSKTWRLKYRFDGKEKLLALGVYPEVSLAEARQRCEDARKLLSDGKDPITVKREITDNSFEAVAHEWHKKRAAVEWSESHAKGIMSRLERHVFPTLGHRIIGDISSRDVYEVFSKIEKAGYLETIRRTLPDCGRIFRHAIATGRATIDPSYKLTDEFPKPVKKHFSTITDPKQVGLLLRDLDEYEGSFTVKCALRLAPLVFLRSSELRLAEWQELDLEEGMWCIPIQRMKRTRRDKEEFPDEVHLVPLARQTVTIFRELSLLTGAGKLVFPGERSRTRAISDMTLTAAIRRMGYTSEELHFHGFRAMARTMIREQLRVDPEIIERQLSHTVANPLGKAYDRTSFIPERKKMMQIWADYLDQLKAGNEKKEIRIRKAE